MKKHNIIMSIIILIVITMYIIEPKGNINATLQGLIVWATSLLPALLPFLFFTKLLTELGLVEKISNQLSPITKRLYNTPGISAYVYVMSILSGYPVGAKITSDLYEKQLITYGQACRITTFTSTSGPLFIIGTVGIGMFNNKSIGIIILACHFIGAILNGLIYRKYNLKNEFDNSHVFKLEASKNILEDTMISSIKSILLIGGYVAVFFMIIHSVNSYGLLNGINNIFSEVLKVFNLSPNLAGAVSNGLIEITKGCFDLSLVTSNPKILAILATFIISFGGFSTHMQALAFLRKFKIKIGFYLLQKTTHAIISMLLCVAVVNFIVPL